MNQPVVHPGVSSFESTGKAESERLLMRQERQAKRKWTAIIFAFLGVSMSMWLYAAMLAVRDPSMAIVPDYHEKALRWDEHMARQAKSEAMGWTVHPIAPSQVDSDGKGMVTVFLRDRDGKPIDGVKGQVRVYHHARASEVQTTDFRVVGVSDSNSSDSGIKDSGSNDSGLAMGNELGTYQFPVTHFRAGTWQIELALEKDGVSFEWARAIDF